MMREVANTSACVIDDDAEAGLWRVAIDTVADDVFALHESLLTNGRRAEVAIAARDHIVLPSSIQLDAELRHRWTFDAYRFFPLGKPPEAQLEELRRDADLVVVSPDVEPVVRTTAMYDPDGLVDQLLGHGFVECRSVPLPDGRVVRTPVREPARRPLPLRPRRRAGTVGAVPRVAVPCANLFHEETEGGEPPVNATARTVADRVELDELLGRKVQMHGRCYCGHVTSVTVDNAVLLDEPDPDD